MREKIIGFSVLTFFFLIGIIGLASASWLGDLFGISGKPDSLRSDSLTILNITDKNFNNKVTLLNSSLVCLKDEQKIVKGKKCEDDKNKKGKYQMIDISNSNMFYKNNGGLIRIANK